MSAKLHYLYDPLCGWCYGAEPLVLAAIEVDGLELVLHGGGLWPEPTQLPEETRRYIAQADGRVGAMSGQPYGDAYLKGLLFDPNLVLESRSTTAAVMAAKSIDPKNELMMLKAIQHAHYEGGRHVVRPEVLLEIAMECGMAQEKFAEAFEQAHVDAHLAESRQLMERIGASGFPAFALEVNGAWQSVPHQQFASDPKAFAKWLSQQAAV